ncbi:MAG: hypothetical protein NXH71_09635 [Erythrobacteraceae bacterium]|jgi:uncharacterized membrane protein|nr:hypothetical protein [Erythrobacteraceae bacterium]
MDTARELTRQAPRTGPWIIGYIVSLGAGAAASAQGMITSPAATAPFWAAMLCCAGMIVYTSWKRHRLLGMLSLAVRSFWRRIVPSAGFMFVSFCLLAAGQAMVWDTQTLRIVSLLPLIGFAGMIWAIHQYTADERDEYLRSLAVRQLITASFVTLMGGLLWAGLQMAGLAINLGVGLVTSGDIGWVLLLWFAGLGVGRLLIELRP